VQASYEVLQEVNAPVTIRSNLFCVTWRALRTIGFFRPISFRYCVILAANVRTSEITVRYEAAIFDSNVGPGLGTL
jgi:hypothetical protein